jgi:hypothetical protein
MRKARVFNVAVLIFDFWGLELLALGSDKYNCAT